MAGYATSDTSNPCQLSASESSVKRGDAAAAEAKKIAPREPCQICLGMAGEKGLFHLRKYRKKDYEFFFHSLRGMPKLAAQGKMDNIIEAKELQIERKHFYVELRENDRGKFLRITEEAHGRRNSIIVPTTGVDDFTAAISEVLTNNGSAPL